MVLPLIALACLAGCDSGSSPKDDAANAARAFAAAYLGDRPQRACSLMTATEQRSFAKRSSEFIEGLTNDDAKQSCPQAIELQLALVVKSSSGDDGTDDASLNQAQRKSRVAVKLLDSGGGIGSIEVDGDNATASEIAGLGDASLELKLEDGEWRIDKFGGNG